MNSIRYCGAILSGGVLAIFCSQSRESHGQLELHDSDGRIRIQSRDTGDGGFGLVFLDGHGKIRASIGTSDTGEPSVQLRSASGEAGIDVAQQLADGKWRIAIRNSDGVVDLGSDSEFVGLGLFDSTGVSRGGLGVRRGEDASLSLRGKDGANHVVIGQRGGSEWMVTVDAGGPASVGLVSSADGASVALASDKKRVAWMTSNGVRTEVSVATSDDHDNTASLIANSERRGLSVMCSHRWAAGLVVERSGDGLAWLGHRGEKFPNGAGPGWYAVATKREATTLMRQDASSTAVVLQDMGVAGSGLTVGSDRGAHVRAGLQQGKIPILSIVDGEGREILQARER